MLINKVQEVLYNTIAEHTSDNFANLSGIFTYLDKNTVLPYIFISMGKVSDLSNFSENIYSYSIFINIFDKNTTNSFAINVMEETKEIFNNTSNFTSDEFSVIDIKFTDLFIERETSSDICKCGINVDFIIKL